MRIFSFLTLPLVALAIPPPTASLRSAVEKREDFFPYLVEDVCHQPDSRFDQVQRYDKMLKAVQKAREMAKLALKEWWDEGKHGEAAATYLAIPNNGTYKDNEYAQRVHANLQNVALLDERIPFLSRKIDVHCTDISDKCNREVEGPNRPIGGYAENTNHFVGGWHYDVVLCMPFFMADTPDHLAEYWPTQSDFRESVAMSFLENDAGKMLHEMMHIDLISADRPHIIDQFYNGARVYTAPIVADWVLNYKAKTADVVQNADSYTQFVNAVFFTSKFGFLPPPQREVPLTGKLECGGANNEYVDKTQDKYIEDFCTNVAAEYQPGSIGEIARQYDEGLPEHVRFRFYRRPGGKLLPNEIKKQCTDTMPKIFHECDTSTNWKHGGAYTFSKGQDDIYTYYVEPRHERPDPIPTKLPGKCDVWYKFWYDEFYIYGGLWAGNDWGQGQLLPNLRRCGIVSEWRFTYKEEPDKDGVEWEAYGRLPIGAQQWNCVRQAVVDSGGPSDIGCGGS
ncbi:uncharacterized protein BDR25DRAFT_344341 [Lindgomyces ingoldianus]|uniref:Uncharacterized protein n=1 Tax=Lindgomyces ingoldianus TaxID=673940 RepID=A0ACB6QN21_9PLEO|nr:uncharacterized protein BDR25DRAFT_344341 [Lindgomyces ingoldianus]KAF2468348.1 hypothetical protein BDR25DRAFT_344341 [Lindgomyces ingoldianus]